MAATGCADYWAKVEFGFHSSTTRNANDAIAAVELARIEAGRLLGGELLDDLVDPDGFVVPIYLVTDNGPAFKSVSFARYIAGRPEFVHVRTRRKSPQTNGVRERAFGTLKYETLYREEITDGVLLASEAERHRRVLNEIRPHETLGFRRPIEAYQDSPAPWTLKLRDTRSEQSS